MRRLTWTMIGTLALILGVGLPAAAQTDSPFRDAVGFSAGIIRVQHGDVRCDEYWGFSAGSELRTKGRSFLAARGDVLGGLGNTCTTQGLSTDFNGPQVEVFTTTELPLVPRVSGRIGHTMTVGEAALEFYLGTGVLYIASSAGSAGGGWSTWYGGGLTFRPRGSQLGVELEYGSREVPVRYVADGATVHDFRRHEGLWRIGIVF